MLDLGLFNFCFLPFLYSLWPWVPVFEYARAMADWIGACHACIPRFLCARAGL